MDYIQWNTFDLTHSIRKMFYAFRFFFLDYIIPFLGL